jgi:hypothetical protein
MERHVMMNLHSELWRGFEAFSEDDEAPNAFALQLMGEAHDS